MFSSTNYNVGLAYILGHSFFFHPGQHAWLGLLIPLGFRDAFQGYSVKIINGGIDLQLKRNVQIYSNSIKYCVLLSTIDLRIASNWSYFTITCDDGCCVIESLNENYSGFYSIYVGIEMQFFSLIKFNLRFVQSLHRHYSLCCKL